MTLQAQPNSTVTSCYMSQRGGRDAGSAATASGLSRSYANELSLPAGGTGRNSKYIAKQKANPSELKANGQLSLASNSEAHP